MSDDAKFSTGKTTIAVTGTGASQLIEKFGNLTLADITTLVTLFYVLYQIYAMFYDRNIKPRGGWKGLFKK